MLEFKVSIRMRKKTLNIVDMVVGGRQAAMYSKCKYSVSVV